MQQQGIIQYILSEDSDILAIGGTNVIQDLKWKNKLCSIVTKQHLVDALKKAADNKYKTSGYYLCVSRCDYIKPMPTYIQYWFSINERTHF